ncbi:MAG: purine-nucleoside phosphorylase [Geminicoccaceae bacterium]|nr:purine-nucleoside phosphorylase [Geminicoccaceae bacterium]
MSDLLEAARGVRARAYAAYSKFSVGCAIRTVSGTVFTGANVENAAYPLGHCAERSAVSAMIAAGENRIAEVAVAGSGERPCAPCGGCRQLLYEHATVIVPVHMVGTSGECLTMSIGDLLPAAFGPADLGKSGGGGEGQSSTPGAMDDVLEAAHALRPRLGLVLGSGLAPVMDRIHVAHSFDLTRLLPGPDRPVEGHGRRLVLGHAGNLPVVCIEGRSHLYEGDIKAPVRLVRLVRDLGVDALLLTSAVGGIRDGFDAGTIVCIDDHINLTGINPLSGVNDDDYGPRFPDMSEAYDRRLRNLLDRASVASGIPLEHGIYAGWMGPSFETPAEIRMMSLLGGDVVGMSVVAEAIAAAHAGLPLAALSIVVNRAAGLDAGKLSHAETLEQGQRAAPRVARLIGAFTEIFS